jgi:hypothetical protein
LKKTRYNIKGGGIMKNKKALIIIAVILVLVLSGGLYLFIWGGEPTVENFVEVRGDYEILAQLALEKYEEISPEKEYVIFDIYKGSLNYDDENFPLDENQQKAVTLIGEEFDYLRVGKDAVFFHEDETGYYGLVYSKHPVKALYEQEIPQRGRDYHRINSCWYEWGVFGL